jgi:transcriptional regulator with XRE-family HTH domain
MQLPATVARYEGSVLNEVSHKRSIGELIRQWRVARKLSQMELALETDISPRHLSFVENGHAKPSVDVLIRLAEYLQVPLRTRNTWLLTAGYAPQYSEQTLDSGRMTHAKAAVQRLLDTHAPYPGVALDRHWNVVLRNDSAENLFQLLPEKLKNPTINIFRASLHPEGFAAHTTNFLEWGSYLLQTMQRLMLNSRDEHLMSLMAEVNAYSNVQALHERMQKAPSTSDFPLLIPCKIRLLGRELAMFTTLTTFGSPKDITLHEVCIELFYPADEATKAFFH